MNDHHFPSSLRRYDCVRRIKLILGVVALLACADRARADYLTQTIAFDQSNALPDGVAYGTYQVEAYDGIGPTGGGLTAGEVRLTFTATALASYGNLGNFGIQKVGFNTDLNLLAGQIDPPPGWKLTPGAEMSGFGRFTWEASGK